MSTANIEDAHAHLENALAHHETGHYAAAQRETRAAKALLETAIADAKPAEHDEISNPTANAGAQVSNGQAPRALLTPEQRRQCDQLRGCQLGYDAKLRAMGVRK